MMMRIITGVHWAKPNDLFFASCFPFTRVIAACLPVMLPSIANMPVMSSLGQLPTNLAWMVSTGGLRMLRLSSVTTCSW